MGIEALLEADFATDNYRHQLREFEEHSDDLERALAWQMRAGKSKAAIDKGCRLFKLGIIDGVLIFAPNGVHENWIDVELPIHGWKTIKHRGIVWRSRVASSKAGNKLSAADRAEWARRLEAWWNLLASVRKNSRLMWFAINTESMTRQDVRRAVARFIKHRRCLVIFDEVDDFGIPSSKCVKMARSIAPKCVARLILSGTMLTGSPLYAFSEFELLRPGALGFKKRTKRGKIIGDYKKFTAHFAEYEDAFGAGGRKFPKLVRFCNLEELREKMAPFMSVVLREDCDDMPDLVPRTVNIEPSKQQARVYEELLDDFIFDLDNGRINVGERAPRFQKLQQVFSGFVIDEHKKVIPIPGPNPRLKAMSREVYRSPGKVIIWCNFQADIDFVCRQLLLDGIKFVEYHGRVSDKAKPEALKAFLENRAIRALVGHPKSLGRGRDVSVASKILWYSHTFSARMRQQAMERATKIGGKNIEVVDFIAPGPDQRIRAVTANRIEMGDFLAGAGMRDFLEGLRL